MLIEVKVPSVGESVTEALLAQWFKQHGDAVKKDEPLFVIETDKVTLEVVAETDGILAIKVPEGKTVAINTVVATIDPEASAEEQPAPQPEEEPAPEPDEQVQASSEPIKEQTRDESEKKPSPEPEPDSGEPQTSAAVPSTGARQK